MILKKKTTVLLISSLLFANPLWAKDSPEKSCKSAAELYDDGDLEGALEEAKWCVTLMEQEKQNNTSKFFLDEVDGYKGGQIDKQNTMGFQVISRTYTKGEKSITVNLNSGSSGSAMQAFAALAQMGVQGAGGQKLRIQRRTATIEADGNDSDMNISLRSGGILGLEGANVSVEDLTSFANAFPVAKLDDSRK